MENPLANLNLSKEDLQAIADGRDKDVSKAAWQAIADNKPLAPPAGDWFSQLEAAHPLIKQIDEYRQAGAHGLLKGATLGLLDTNKPPPGSDILAPELAKKQAADSAAAVAAHPTVDKIAEGVGQALPVVMGGAAVEAVPGLSALEEALAAKKYPSLLGAPQAVRAAKAGVALGGVMGLKTPEEGESRLSNFINGFKNGTAGGVAAEALGGLYSPVAKKMGSILGGLAPEEASAYVDNPEAANALRDMVRNSPDELNELLRNKLKGSRVTGQSGAIEDLLNNVATPARAAKVSALQDKMITLPRSAFEGTSVEPDLEVLLKKETPYGKTTDQARFNPDGTLNLNALEADKLAQKAGNNAYSKLYGPQEPSSAAMDAADEKLYGTVGRALEATDPSIAAHNATIGQSMRMASQARGMNTNLGRLLQPGEPQARLNPRALATYLDKNAGTDFSNMADQLAAAKKLDPYVEHGLTNKKFVAKKLLESINGMNSATQSPALQSLMGYGIQKGTQ